jgi:hypothetical protein
MTYEEVRARLAEDFGWTFDVIDDMSFEQIRSAITRGEPDRGIPVSSVEEAREVAANWRTYLGV